MKLSNFSVWAAVLALGLNLYSSRPAMGQTAEDEPAISEESAAEDEYLNEEYLEAPPKEKHGFFKRVFNRPVSGLKRWRDTDPAVFPWHDDVTRERSRMGLRSRKLGRGIINVFTGWLEIPKSMDEKWRETDPITGCALGFVQGCGWGIARTIVGFYEVGTFWWGAPNGYGPMMKPEFILPTIWGAETPLTDRIEMD